MLHNCAPKHLICAGNQQCVLWKPLLALFPSLSRKEAEATTVGWGGVLGTGRRLGPN